jgi:hypothetical protein
MLAFLLITEHAQYAQRQFFFIMNKLITDHSSFFCTASINKSAYFLPWQNMPYHVAQYAQRAVGS